jgi:hypothetical protein
MQPPQVQLRAPEKLAQRPSLSSLLQPPQRPMNSELRWSAPRWEERNPRASLQGSLVLCFHRHTVCR